MADPTPFVLPPEGVEGARRALDLGLCDECLGRLFGRLGHGLSNPERAARLRTTLGARPPQVGATCSLCRGAFERWDVWADRCLRAADGFEWHRFTCGSRWDPELLAQEESLGHAVGTSWAETARSAFNRELGKRLEARTGNAGGPDRPDVVFLADLPVGRVEITVLPVYFRGRYRKLDRTLPQTRWPCRRCQGRGCTTCKGTGHTYPTSVEELIAAPALALTGATGSRFHGMGREDIDARMLGRGRPFVLELVRPRTRRVAPETIVEEIRRTAGDRVEVLDLRSASAEDVLLVKEASPEKTYRVTVLGEAPTEKVNEALEVAQRRALLQRTPTRVVHRRADRVRTRRIVSARLVDAGDGRFTLELRTEGGTYIKEWVEGDAGRTEPSLSGLVGAPLKVESLDVMEIHDSEG